MLQKKLLEKIGCCEYCGYSKHKEVLELAHIVHGDDVDLMRPTNIFLLCPTCHKCFDYGFILVKGVQSKSVKINFFSKLYHKKLFSNREKVIGCRWPNKKLRVW